MWEEYGALRRVLESRAGDVAPAVRVQHGDSRCSQCTSFRSAVLVALHGLSLACLHGVGRDSQKSRLVSAKTNTGMCICGDVWAKYTSVDSACWGVGRYGNVGCCGLLGYSSILAAVESLHGTRVLLMGTQVPLAVFCAARAIPCPKKSVLQAGGLGGGL